MTLFKFICVQYQFHRQTLPIMKIDRGQIQFRDYVSTGTEPDVDVYDERVDDDDESDDVGDDADDDAPSTPVVQTTRRGRVVKPREIYSP